MSRFAAPSSRPVFASKVAFDALEIESAGEESEEELAQEEEPTTYVSSVASGKRHP